MPPHVAAQEHLSFRVSSTWPLWLLLRSLHPLSDEGSLQLAGLLHGHRIFWVGCSEKQTQDSTQLGKEALRFPPYIISPELDYTLGPDDVLRPGW